MAYSNAPYRNAPPDDGFDDFDDFNDFDDFDDIDSPASSAQTYKEPDGFDDSFDDSFDDGFDDGFDDSAEESPYSAPAADKKQAEAYNAPFMYDDTYKEEFEPGPAKPIKEPKAKKYALTFLSFLLVIAGMFITAYFDSGFVPKDILSWKIGGASISDLFKIGSAEELIEHVPEKEEKPSDEPVYTDESMPDSVRYSDFEIHEGNTYCSINGYNGSELEITLPSVYNGKPCTRIEANAFTNSPVLSIVIPDSYTYIGQNAFSGCSMTDLYLPDSVTEIGWGMCSGSKNLKSVRIPPSLETIAEWSFSNCTSLTKLEIPGSVKTVGQWAFTDCVSITDIVLSEGIEKLDNCAFYGCTDIKTIIVPSTVTSIGEMCFRSCTSLMIVSIPETLESIGKNAFMNCSQVLTFFGEVGGQWETYATENSFYFDSIENLDLTEGDDPPEETSQTDTPAPAVSSSDSPNDNT